MSTVFVSEHSFRRRTGYAGSWLRIEPYNRVVLDIDIIPFIGETNANFLRDLIDEGTYQNVRQQQLVDQYLIDLTAQYMAWRAATVLYKHFNNAGATSPGVNPATETGVKLLKDYYLNTAQAIQVQMEKFYCKYSAELKLPQPIGGTVSHAPFSGFGINVDLNLNKITQEKVIVPIIDIEKRFYYGLIPIGEPLTIERILAGENVAPADSVSWIPQLGITHNIWFASERNNYATWAIDSSVYNTSTLGGSGSLFNQFAICEFITWRSQWVTETNELVLTIST